MNALSLQIGLRGAGVMLVCPVVANFFAPKRWRYEENLAGAEPMVRQIFHVHCAYILSIMAALALLCLGWPQLLMDGGMGKVLCGFFGLFWGSRVWVQLACYDRQTRRENRGWDILFISVFAALSAVFTLTALFP